MHIIDVDQEIEFHLFVNIYKLVKPLINVDEPLTYSTELYVSAGLIKFWYK